MDILIGVGECPLRQKRTLNYFWTRHWRVSRILGNAGFSDQGCREGLGLFIDCFGRGHPGFTSGCVLKNHTRNVWWTIFLVGDWTRVGSKQDKCLNPCTLSLFLWSLGWFPGYLVMILRWEGNLQHSRRGSDLKQSPSWIAPWGQWKGAIVAVGLRAWKPMTPWELG